VISMWMPWKIAKKELKVIRRKKSIILYTILFPFFLSIGFLLVVKSDIAPSNGISSNYQLGLESLTYFYVVLAAIVPSSIAAYSIVGEKIEKSLEPLLVAPITDGEILLGKGIAAFLPPMLAIWAAASLFMATTDYLTYNLLSYYYFPNWNSVVMLFLIAPLAAILSIELGVIVSARVNDIRGANQIGSLMFIPFMGIFLAGVEGIISLDFDTLLTISVFVLLFDVVLFFVSKSTFQREEILTKWK
jgi:ABC-2 type transport system permease protein